MLSQQDLKNMIDRMERLSRSGDKDAAKQLLEQLQQMLENLQMAQPGQSGGDDMEQALNELGDMDPQAAAVARQDLQAGARIRGAIVSAASRAIKA